jgi:hypothetical protein
MVLTRCAVGVERVLLLGVGEDFLVCLLGAGVDLLRRDEEALLSLHAYGRGFRRVDRLAPDEERQRGSSDNH